MPTYQYSCTACGHELEAVQSFSDDPLSECPECQGRLRKRFGSVGVVFKGSGFYRTDSRAANGSGGDGSGGGSGGDGAGKDTAKDATPRKDSDTGTSSAKESAGASGGKGGSGGGAGSGAAAAGKQAAGTG